MKIQMQRVATEHAAPLQHGTFLQRNVQWFERSIVRMIERGSIIGKRGPGQQTHLLLPPMHPATSRSLPTQRQQCILF